MGNGVSPEGTSRLVVSFVTSAFIAVVVRQVVLLFDVTAGAAEYVMGSSVVALAVWAVKEELEPKNKVYASKVLSAFGLEWLKGYRWLGVAVEVGLGIYLVALPSLSIACSEAGPLAVLSNGKKVLDIQCPEIGHVIRFPSGWVPTLGPGIRIEDSYPRVALRELSPLGHNHLEYPNDFRAPRSVLFQLPRQQALDARFRPAAAEALVCEKDQPYCLELAGFPRLALPLEGLLVGRRQASAALLAARDAILATGGVPFAEPVKPPAFSVDYRPGAGPELHAILIRVKEGLIECAPVTCVLQAEGETLCSLDTLKFAPCSPSRP